MFIVLVTHGKHDSVDYASVHLFEDSQSASDFCQTKNTGAKKYWTKAERIADGEEVELCMPEGNY